MGLPRGFNYVRTITYEDFRSGMDLREGLVTRDSSKFLDLLNMIATFGRKIIRRFPFAHLTGELDAKTQGLFYLNGSYVTVAKAGDTIAHTIVGIPVTTVYFDIPDYTTGWKLLGLVALNETLVACIRHTFPGGTVTSRIMLHVWDDKRPTWVEDPAAPTNWSPSFPLQAYGQDTAGAFKDYTPKLTVVANHLHMVMPNGNVAESAVNKPRVWSDRDANDILSNGRSWYFITPDIGSTFSFILPIPYVDLTQPQKYAAYVCERMFDDGVWRQFREVGSLIQSGDYKVESVASRFGTGTETKITMLWAAGPGRVIRFRVLAKPSVTILSGLVLTPSGAVSGGTLDIEGASYDIDPFSVDVSTPSTSYVIAVPAPPAPIPLVAQYAGGAGSMPLNGQQRYWSAIIAVAETNGGGSAFEFAYTGTVAILTGQTAVLGTATAFLTEAIPGESIVIDGQERTIRTVTSDTQLEVTAAWGVTTSGVSALKDVSYQYAHEIGDSGNFWYAQRESDATFLLAGLDDASVLNTSLYDPSGGVPIALGAAQNRLLVQYAESLQLWEVNADPTTNRHLSTDATGAGHNTSPTPVLVDGYILLPTHAGPRMFTPEGQNKDYIKQVQIGDLINSQIRLVDLQRAVWWARLRLYVTCEGATTDGSDLTLWAFAYHPSDKTTSWSRIVVAGLTSVDQLFVANDKLYVLSGREVWRADADATSFIDANDTPGDAFVSRARWLYNDFGAPEYDKQLITLDMQQVGRAKVSIYVSPADQAAKTRGPSASGYTQGLQRVLLSLFAPTVGLEIETQDESGYTLNAVGFTYKLLKR